MSSSDDLTAFLDLVRSDADQESMTHDPEDCGDWRNSCSAHNTLRVAAMVRGVLELAGEAKAAKKSGKKATRRSALSV